MNDETLAPIANATSIPWAEVPEWPVADFVRVVAEALTRNGRLCSWFGVTEPVAGPALSGAEGAGAIRLVAVVAFDAENTLAVGRSTPFSEKKYPALTTLNHQAHLFEREVWEQFGVEPEGHPWLKPVRRTAGNAPAVG